MTERSVKVFCTRTLWVTEPDGASTQGRFGVLRTSMPGAGLGQKALRPWLTTAEGVAVAAGEQPGRLQLEGQHAAEAAGVRDPVQPSPVSGSSAAIWKRGWVFVSVSR